MASRGNGNGQHGGDHDSENAPLIRNSLENDKDEHTGSTYGANGGVGTAKPSVFRFGSPSSSSSSITTTTTTSPPLTKHVINRSTSDFDRFRFPRSEEDDDNESSPDDDDERPPRSSVRSNYHSNLTRFNDRRKNGDAAATTVNDTGNESDGGSATAIGSLSDSAAARNPKTVRAKYAKKVRRNPTANRSLWKFKRIKQHKLVQLAKSTEDELYDAADDPDMVEQKAPNKLMYRLSAFCTCDSYDLSDIIDDLEANEIFVGKLTLYADVLQIKQKALKRDVFIFTYGCVVFFNWPEKLEQHFLSTIRAYSKQPLNEYEVEDFDFCYGEQTSVANDEITFQTHSSLEKLSVSFALAQCVKLSIYEERIAAEIERNKHLPQTLARTGSIGMSRSEISKKIGTLFIERNNVNLHFDVLDSPEFFWEQDKFKHVYDRLFNYLELGKRVDLLNKRLDIMKELLDMLNDQLENFHAHKLEWIIIWLIVFEVVVLVFWNILLKDILGFFKTSDYKDWD